MYFGTHQEDNLTGWISWNSGKCELNRLKNLQRGMAQFTDKGKVEPKTFGLCGNVSTRDKIGFFEERSRGSNKV